MNIQNNNRSQVTSEQEEKTVEISLKILCV